MNKERGIALITTLLLGLIAALLIGTVLYILMSGTVVSGAGKRYSIALEAAKGASEYIIKRLLAGNLTCGGGGTCSPTNNVIDLGPYSSIQGFNIRAIYLGEISKFGVYVYSIRISASSPSAQETAVVDFVYKVE